MASEYFRLPYEGMGLNQCIRTEHRRVERHAEVDDKSLTWPGARPMFFNHPPDDLPLCAALEQHRAAVWDVLCPGRDYGVRSYGGDGDRELAWYTNTTLADETWFAPIDDMFGLIDDMFEPIDDLFEITSDEEQELPPVLPASPKPIPVDIQTLADHINGLPQNPRGRKDGGLPSRNTLKKDVQLKGEVSRKTGCLRLAVRGGKLRQWVGDLRLFDARMWLFLTEESYLAEQAAAGEAVAGRKRKDPGASTGDGEDESTKKRRKKASKPQQQRDDSAVAVVVVEAVQTTAREEVPTSSATSAPMPQFEHQQEPERPQDSAEDESDDGVVKATTDDRRDSTLAQSALAGSQEDPPMDRERQTII